MVLDLIRGLDVRRADEILQFTTRDVAQDIRKVLASAVANAVHNDEQDADELFVLACFADEGPTLRRFRPRARGRATRIRKRTCHITVVVARLSDDRLEVIAEPPAGAVGHRSAPCRHDGPARRDRVERSRHAGAQGLRGRAERRRAPTEHLPEETPGADVDAVDATEVIVDDVDEELEVEAEAQATADIAESELAEPDVARSSAEAAADLPEGAVVAPDDGSVPDGYAIKGNANSMKYHVPGGRYYDITIAEVFFDTAEHAEAAGYEAPAVDTEESN